MSNIAQTQHALYMFTKTFNNYQNVTLSAQLFSDGIPFAVMLASVQNLDLKIQQLQQKSQKWSTKLTNLKKILQKLQHFVQSQYQKSLKLNDLQLVQISKNSSIQEILKFFQVVISVLMQTPQKEDYIQAIMSLDQRSQQALVVIVQNAMEFRLCDTKQSQPLNVEKMHRLETQNKILSQEITQLCTQNQTLLKNIQTLKKRLEECQQQIQKARHLHLQMYMEKTNSQQQNSRIQLLKTKMVQLSRQHEIQITKISDQNYHLKNQIAHFRQIQEDYKDKIELCQIKIRGKNQQFQNQRRQLLKNLQQKEAKLRKYEYQLEIAKSKIRQLSEDLQVTDLNMRMELEKKQVRFKQLQKQVKNRLIDSNDNGQKLVKQSQITDQQDELQYLKVQVQKLRNSNRQLERQNLKSKKKLQKTQLVENEKKKLQRIILDVSKSRDQQIQMLVVCLYDLRNQNIRMHSIIKELQSK